MAVRTTALAVQGVLQRDYDTVRSPSLIPYIESASLIVDRVKTCAAAKDKALTTAELEMIERWLAAHMYQQSDKGFASNSTQGASASFQGQTGQGFESTMYGQQAMRVDWSRCLFAIDKGLMAGGFWIGKTKAEEATDAD